MKLKIFFTAVISVLIILSVSQMFFIPPYAGDVFPLYKSGYFHELDRGFLVIKEAFIGVKTLGRPEYGWIFLQDVEKSQKISVKVYDALGRQSTAPGMYDDARDGDVVKAMASMNEGVLAAPAGGSYRGIINLRCEDKCGICHRDCRPGKMMGAMVFERDYDAGIYYSSERVIIFLAITALLCAVLFFVLRWDPGRNIKELFDK